MYIGRGGGGEVRPSRNIGFKKKFVKLNIKEKNKRNLECQLIMELYEAIYCCCFHLFSLFLGSTPWVQSRVETANDSTSTLEEVLTV